MSRLLFAAARGARIEMLHDAAWHRTYAILLDNDGAECRIHPDDEHLQYGPVSTALRTSAEDPPLSLDACFPVLDYFCANANYREWSVFKHENEMQRSLFLLILAEALADEGM